MKIFMKLFLFAILLVAGVGFYYLFDSQLVGGSCMVAATLAVTNSTWLDYARVLGPNHKVMKIIERIAQTNEMAANLYMCPSNMDTGHKETVRTAYGSSGWRQINKGIVASKNAEAQITFTPGVIEDHGIIDEELLANIEDKVGFRIAKNMGKIESIAQTIASTLIYGDQTVNPERFTGLTHYYDSTVAETAKNLILAGGAGADNTSLWLVGTGPRKIHTFYPKNVKLAKSEYGIEHEDMGRVYVGDGETPEGHYWAWMDKFKARLGLAVCDWRYAARIANIDISDLATAGDTSDSSANLVKLMIQALNKIPNRSSTNLSWYCNEYVKTAIETKIAFKGNLLMTPADMKNGLGPVTYFLGVPVRQVDAITIAEDLVS